MDDIKDSQIIFIPIDMTDLSNVLYIDEHNKSPRYSIVREDGYKNLLNHLTKINYPEGYYDVYWKHLFVDDDSICVDGGLMRIYKEDGILKMRFCRKLPNPNKDLQIYFNKTKNLIRHTIGRLNQLKLNEHEKKDKNRYVKILAHMYYTLPPKLEVYSDSLVHDKSLFKNKET